MTLSIFVGGLANCVAEESLTHWGNRFERVNEALREGGLPEHHEPRHLNGKQSFYANMFHADLWQLRRLAAYIRRQIIESDEDLERVKEWPPPCEPDLHPSDDPVLKAYYDDSATLYDHLFYHSDCTGFYLPLEMDDVFVPSEKLREYVGGCIGSSPGLLRICEDVAKMIGLPLDLNTDDKAFENLITVHPKRGKGCWLYPRECLALLNLANAARKSLELGAAIVFWG